MRARRGRNSFEHTTSKRIGSASAAALEEFADRNIERFDDVDQSLVEQSSAAVLDVDEDVSDDTGLQRKRFLSHVLACAHGADVEPDQLAPMIPLRDVLGIAATN